MSHPTADLHMILGQLRAAIDGLTPTSPTVPRVVQQLVALRRRSSLSQTRLAELIGTSQSAISELETGVASPTLSTLARYAQQVGMEVVSTPAANGTRSGPEPSERGERQIAPDLG